ncbi:MAG: hypothetical protein HGA19_14460 [Oscillochloris sp.]|nr:hypothetical protein [Oscillochloris sp.]
MSDDGRSWEIKLRDGISWHDGTPLTAEDVAFTLSIRFFPIMPVV